MEVTMSASVIKQGKKIEEYSAEERAILYAQTPYFSKKRKNTAEFIKKAGLPERFSKKGKSK